MSTATRTTEAPARARPSMGLAGRVAHGLLAALALGANVASLYIGATETSTIPEGGGWSRVWPAGWPNLLNQPMFFTFMSNFLVGITALLLAIRPGGRGAVFHVLRLSGLVCLVITGVVFNVLLRDDSPLPLFHAVLDAVQHVGTPILAPLLWLVFGPRGQVTGARVLWSALVPVAWLVVTLVRGALVDWYPYVILDVPSLGYGGVGVFVGAILVFYFMVGGLLWLLDRLLGGNLEQVTDRALQGIADGGQG